MTRNSWVLITLLLLALVVRSAGLFHGLESGVSFHPDASKQVNAAQNYLNGIYLWYNGSLAYDGYPYGLNHVDEWLLRGVWPMARLVMGALDAGLELSDAPSKIALHYILRALRVLYSLCAWGLFAWMLRRLKPSRVQYALWLTLAALAPISSIVTHAATGDVGTDLFVMIALALLLHARNETPHALLFAGSGFALGCAFACKYHGILAALVPALFLLLAPITWRRRISLGLATGIGAIAGFIALTPHVLLAPKKTLELIGANFGYIKNYGVDPSFFQLPLLERWALCWRNNTPIILDALGVVAFVLALIALALAVRRIFTKRDAERAWDLAIIATPFIGIAAALSGKPQLQPFHFSFFALPVLLGGALIPAMSKNRLLQVALPALLALGVMEYAAKQKYDLYYWLRNDTLEVSTRMECDLVASENEKSGQVVARLATEEDNRAVFRNRPTEVKLANAGDWVAHPDELLPSTSWPIRESWIFTDIPAFPRESRLIQVEANQDIRRVVITAAGKELPITIYTGSRRAEVALRCGDQAQNLALDPFESRQIIIPADTGEYFTSKNQTWRRRHARIVSRGAPVLVRFGAAPVTPPDPARRDRKLAQAQFLYGVSGVEGDGLLRDRCLTPGIYAMEVGAARDAAPMTLVVTDSLMRNRERTLRLPLEWTNEMWRVEWRHPRDLLFANIGLSVKDTGPDAWPLPWRIRPIEALPIDEPETRNREWRPMVSFDHKNWTLGNIEIPERAAANSDLTIRLQLDSTVKVMRDIRGYVAFVHLLDKDGVQVFQHNIPLVEIPAARSGLDIRRDLGILDVLAGRYEVRIGIYTPRTKKRLKPDSANAGRDKRVSVGFIDVE